LGGDQSVPQVDSRDREKTQSNLKTTGLGKNPHHWEGPRGVFGEKQWHSRLPGFSLGGKPRCKKGGAKTWKEASQIGHLLYGA